MFVSLSAVALAGALAIGSVPTTLEATGTAANDGPVAASVEADAPLWWQLWVGEYFREDIDQWDRTGPSTYRVAEHSLLPKGLKLNARTGVVSGVPEEEVVQLTTFLVTHRETGEVRQQFAVFRADNPVRGEPVPDWRDFPDEPDGLGARRD